MSEHGPDYQYGQFFKYRAFGERDSNTRKWLADLIVDRAMMFSSPTAFNDPYDCRPAFYRGENPAEDRRAIERAWEEGRVRAGHPRPSNREVSQHVTQIMVELSTPGGAQRQFQQYLDERTGVFCMSRRWDILTQWAYYADNGTGLCLEYTVTPDSAFNRVFAVEYDDDRPAVSVVRMLHDDEYRTEALFRSITTKAPVWKHEDECRALEMTPGIHQHSEGLLTSILVGQESSDEDIGWLKQLLGDASMDHIPIEQTKLSERTFVLERAAVE